MKILGIFGLILMSCVAFAQHTSFVSGTASGGGSDTNLDYVGTATNTTSGATTLDVTYTIPEGHTNKLILFDCGIENYETVSVSSCVRQDNSTALTLVGFSSPSGSDRQAATMYYLKDADMPSSGSITIRITTSASMQMAGRIRFYNGAHQTTPVSNATTDEACGGASSALTVNSNDMSYDWTTNSCYASVGCLLNGASTGSQYVEVHCLDGDQSPSSVTASGTGHTNLGSITTVLAWTYWGYKNP